MLESASDYEYLPTAGIESALSGSIVPVADVAGMDSAYLYHDFCYLVEMLKVYLYNYGNSTNINIDYMRKSKYRVLEQIWGELYNRLDPTTNGNSGAYGCDIFLSTAVEQMPTFPRRNTNNYQSEKQALSSVGLLLDLTPYMDANPWSSGGALGLHLNTCPFAASVIRTLYWVMFRDCYQEMRGSSDSMTEYYDKSCTWAPRTLKSGTATVHNSSGGVITTLTAVVQNSSSSGSYIDLDCVEGGSHYYDPLVLQYYRYYGTTPGGQYESGYEYCYDGVDGDAYMNIDFRRDDILSAYALVQYTAWNNSTNRRVQQYKLEPVTQDSGRRWSFKAVDKAFAKSLMEYHGADFSKVGERSSSQTLNRYSCESSIYYIFVKFDHKYASGIANVWQWQP